MGTYEAAAKERNQHDMRPEVNEFPHSIEYLHPLPALFCACPTELDVVAAEQNTRTCNSYVQDQLQILRLHPAFSETIQQPMWSMDECLAEDSLVFTETRGGPKKGLQASSRELESASLEKKTVFASQTVQLAENIHHSSTGSSRPTIHTALGQSATDARPLNSFSAPPAPSTTPSGVIAGLLAERSTKLQAHVDPRVDSAAIPAPTPLKPLQRTSVTSYNYPGDVPLTYLNYSRQLQIFICGFLITTADGAIVLKAADRNFTQIEVADACARLALQLHAQSVVIVLLLDVSTVTIPCTRTASSRSSVFQLNFPERFNHRVIEACVKNWMPPASLPAIIADLLEKCPLTQESKCGVSDSCCIPFRFEATTLHNNAIPVGDLIRWLQTHFRFSHITDYGPLPVSPQVLTSASVSSTSTTHAHATASSDTTSLPQFEFVLHEDIMQNYFLREALVNISRVQQTLEFIECVLRVLLHVLPNRKMAIRGRHVVTRESARTYFVHAIATLPAEVSSELQNLLLLLAIQVRFMSREALIGLATPQGMVSKAADVQSNLPPGSAGLPEKIAHDLKLLVSQCFPRKNLAEDESVSLRLDDNIVMHGGHPHFVLSLEGQNTHKQARIIILTGAFLPQNTDIFTTIPVSNRVTLSSFSQNLPARILISKALKRPEDEHVQPSVIVLVGLFEPHENVKPISADHADREIFKTKILRLRDCSTWSAEDFFVFLTQIAWVHHKMADWAAKSVQAFKKLSEKRNISSIFNIPVSTEHSHQTSHQSGSIDLQYLLESCDFSMPDILIIKQYVYDRQELQQTDVAVKNEFELKVEEIALRGQAALKMGNGMLAIQEYLDAMKLVQSNPDKCRQELKASIIGNLGVAYQSIGEFRAALEYHSQHQKLCEGSGQDQGALARTYANLGIAHQSLGNPAKAISFHLKHLHICEEVTHDVQGQGRAYCNLGISYHSLGDFKKAIDYHQKHLAICLKRTKDRMGESRAYANLGIAYQSLRQLDRAIIYHYQHLRICLDETRDQRGEAAAYGNLGNAYHLNKQFDRAIEFHTKHRAKCLDSATSDRMGYSKACSNLGNAYMAAGDFKNALKHHQEHLRMCELADDSIGAIAAYSNLAHAYWRCLDHENAVRMITLAVQLHERQEPFMAQGDVSARLAVFEQQSHLYRHLQYMLAESGQCSAALLVAEQQRYEMLIDLYTESDLSETRAAKPKSVQDLVKVATDFNCTFIEYSLIPEESCIFIWVISPSSKEPHFVSVPFLHIEDLGDVAKFALQAPCSFTAAVGSNEVGFQQLLLELNLGKLEGFFRSIGWSNPRTLQQGLRALQLNPSALHTLSREHSLELEERTLLSAVLKTYWSDLYKLLIEPIEKHLPKCAEDRVVIVPSGPLYTVPFAALAANSASGETFLDQHTFTISFSIGFFAESMRRSAKAFQSSNLPLSMLFVGDENHNPRRAHGSSRSMNSDSSELQVIDERMRAAGCIVLATSGMNAQTLAVEMQRASLVHFACRVISLERETLWDRKVHMLFSKNESSSSYLTAKDLASLSSSQVQTVVLSGCCGVPREAQTVSANLPIISDGCFGLVRAFLRTPATAVVTPLWYIDEHTSSAFMSLFYDELASTPISRRSYAHILRKCMLRFRSDPRFAHPMSWACFVGFGDSFQLATPDLPGSHRICSGDERAATGFAAVWPPQLRSNPPIGALEARFLPKRPKLHNTGTHTHQLRFTLAE